MSLQIHGIQTQIHISPFVYKASRVSNQPRVNRKVPTHTEHLFSLEYIIYTVGEGSTLV